MKGSIVIVRGGGDIATGTIQKLHRCGFRVLVLEVEKPTAIRRTVSLSEAVYDGRTIVEDMTAILVYDKFGIEKAWNDDLIPIMVDPVGNSIKDWNPMAVVDAIIAKKNLGTNLKMAPITIALGPGFEAGKDVDVVIETNRGHKLGRVIFNGIAQADTGTPGDVAGYTTERVLKSPTDGILKTKHKIGDWVKKWEIVATVNDQPIYAKLDGIIRGMIRDGFSVFDGMKVGDIDPRKEELENCFTISDKARAVSGGVLEAVLILYRTKKLWEKGYTLL